MCLDRHGDAVGHAAEHLVEVGPEPCVHHVVDDRVHAGVRHCQPVEREVHVANVRLPDERHFLMIYLEGQADSVLPGDGGIMVREYEVDVVRGPAHHEDHCGEGEHLDDLLLVVPAFGQGRLGHEEAQGGLAGCPEVAAHLGVAHRHAQHRQHVRQEEEEDIVAETYR